MKDYKFEETSEKYTRKVRIFFYVNIQKIPVC